MMIPRTGVHDGDGVGDGVTACTPFGFAATGCVIVFEHEDGGPTIPTTGATRDTETTTATERGVAPGRQRPGAACASNGLACPIAFVAA